MRCTLKFRSPPSAWLGTIHQQPSQGTGKLLGAACANASGQPAAPSSTVGTKQALPGLCPRPPSGMAMGQAGHQAMFKHNNFAVAVGWLLKHPLCFCLPPGPNSTRMGMINRSHYGWFSGALRKSSHQSLPILNITLPFALCALGSKNYSTHDYGVKKRPSGALCITVPIKNIINLLQTLKPY